MLVEHVNMVKKHQRPTQKLRQGGIIEREGPLALSNVLLVCSRCDKPSRTGIKMLGRRPQAPRLQAVRRVDRQGLDDHGEGHGGTPAPKAQAGRKAPAQPQQQPRGDKGRARAPVAKTRPKGTGARCRRG